MKLYELTTEIALAEKMLDEWAEMNEGDLTGAPAMELLDKLEMDKTEKILSIGTLIKNVNADVSAFGDEIKNLQARQERAKKKIESLMNYISINCNPGDKFENKQVRISWTKSGPVVVDCEVEALPAEYKRVKTTTEPDKKALKELCKKGSNEYAHINEKHTLKVK